MFVRIEDTVLNLTQIKYMVCHDEPIVDDVWCYKLYVHFITGDEYCFNFTCEKERDKACQKIIDKGYRGVV